MRALHTQRLGFAALPIEACWQGRMAVIRNSYLSSRHCRAKGAASAVVGTTAWFRQLPATASEVNYDPIGEAVVVEVMPGRYLLAQIGNPSELFDTAARERFAGMRMALRDPEADRAGRVDGRFDRGAHLRLMS